MRREFKIIVFLLGMFYCCNAIYAAANDSMSNINTDAMIVSYVSTSSEIATSKEIENDETAKSMFNDLLHEDAGMDKLNNSFQLAINALTFDNPDLFYIDVTKVYLLTEITTRAFSKTYRVSIGGNGSNYLFDNFIGGDSLQNAIDDE